MTKPDERSVDEIASNLVEDWTKRNKINRGEDCDSWIVVWHLNDLERMIIARLRTERTKQKEMVRRLRDALLFVYNNGKGGEVYPQGYCTPDYETPMFTRVKQALNDTKESSNG